MSIELTSLRNALQSLGRGMTRHRLDRLDEELRDACIQRFKYCFELSWKMLKRQIEAETANTAEVDGYSKRTLFRVAAERGLIDSPEPWFVYLVQRNKTSHAYNTQVATELAAILENFFTAASLLLTTLENRNA